MNSFFPVAFGLLFLLYAQGTITLTQLLLLLALLSTVTVNCCNCSNNTATTL